MIWYQGVLNVGRGLEEMIDAMVLLPDEWRFEMAGEGDIKPFLLEKVASLGLANRVLFHGHLNRVEMASRSADAFAGINLLRSDSKNYYLSLANKYFDYVQQGVPQLCMNFPEYSRLQAVFPVAVLLDGIEPSKIADHILKLAADSMAYHELQLAIMKARQEWIWENEEIKLLDLYKSIPS
jgi:glycosyltransferase involved in cell wall biosynthesis